MVYKSAAETATRLAQELRELGADLVVALTHQREPNDFKLATDLPPNLVDIILGGHDHFYAHTIINGITILRSGTDFKQLSYIEGFRNVDGCPEWKFDVVRRDVVSSIPEDRSMAKLVAQITSDLNLSLNKGIAVSSIPLDSRCSTVRQSESNFGNFVSDLLRSYYSADCALLSGGTIRGDQLYPAGILRLKDILGCFPFEDPVVLLRVRGHAIVAALENGVSQLPALEGRFCQVSNIIYGVRLDKSSGSRLTFVRLGDKPIDLHRTYTLATVGYMARGKDGFSSLNTVNSEVEVLVRECEGAQIVTILRQYFLRLEVPGTGSDRVRDFQSRTLWNHTCTGLSFEPLSPASEIGNATGGRPEVCFLPNRYIGTLLMRPVI